MVLEESRTETSSIAWVTGRHEAGNEGRRLSIKSFDDRFITLPGMSTHQPQNYTSFTANFHSITFLLKGETVIYVKGTLLWSGHLTHTKKIIFIYLFYVLRHQYLFLDTLKSPPLGLTIH